jgi:hypothetical protein
MNTSIIKSLLTSLCQREVIKPSFMFSRWRDKTAVLKRHPELVSGSHAFVAIRNYEILNQVQNDTVHKFNDCFRASKSGNDGTKTLQNILYD